MSVDIINTRKVWEVISDFSNVTEYQSRRICRDFTAVVAPCPEDGSAADHYEMVEGIIQALEDPDIRETMLRDMSDISIIENDEGDPFYYNAKLQLSDIDFYYIPHTGSYDCVICGDEGTSRGGVKLSCTMDQKPCKAVYCRDCITPWLTKGVSRCPTCRKFCETIKNVPIDVRPKRLRKRPVITTKKTCVIITARKKI